MIDSPNMTVTGENAISEIKSYLYRLSEQLNYELSKVEKIMYALNIGLEDNTVSLGMNPKRANSVEIGNDARFYGKVYIDDGNGNQINITKALRNLNNN